MKINKHLYLILISLFISSSKTQGATPLTDHVPPLPIAGMDIQLHNFVDAYKVYLFPHYSSLANLNHTFADAQATYLFNTYFFWPRSPAALPSAANSVQFLLSLKEARNDIQTFTQQPDQIFAWYLRKKFQETLNIIADRYGLAKIENMVINGNGFLGPNVIPIVPDGPAANVNIFRNTISNLIGRIFVVKNIGGVSRIMGSSSGMIIPRKRGGVVVYDRIITCCHSMMPTDSSLGLEFYFVRSQNLNPATGLPNSTTIGPVIAPALAPGQTYDQIVNSQHFIAYLRQESNSLVSHDIRRITKFKSFDRHTSKLDHHTPKYNPETDCGYGTLNREFLFPAANFAKICILHNLPVGIYHYYALGYPGFPYYDTTGLNVLSQEQQISPLTMTRGQSNTPDPAIPGPGHFMLMVMNNGLLRHEASSMKGMSGGPVLIFDQLRSKINILGIVGYGSMDENYACKFW